MRVIINLSASTFLSGTGMALFFTFSSLFIQKKSQSSLYVSISSILSSLFVLIVLSYLSNKIDKFSKRNILIYIYLISSFLSLFGAYFSSKVSNETLIVLIIIAYTIFFSIVRSIDQISRTAYIKIECNEKSYYSNNKILEGIRQGITFISGGIASIFLGITLNPLYFFIFNSIIFFISVFPLLAISKDKLTIIDKKTNKKISFYNKILEGYKSLIKLPNNYLLIFSMIPYITVVSLNVTYPAYFLEINSNPIFYAFLSIPYGAGALFASFKKFKNINFEILFIKYLIIFVIFVFVGSFSKNSYLSYICLFFIAYSHATIRINRNTYLMNITGRTEISKILSLFEIIFILGSILMSLILGYLTDLFSPKISWIVLGVFITFVICITFKLIKIEKK